jgi:multiple antibiotic resistance protein
MTTQDLTLVGVNVLYLLALLNPMSKVSILIAFPPDQQKTRLRAAATRASLVAAAILFVTMIIGDFLLRVVFHVELYALQLAGGVVVFWVGMNGLRKGRFFEHDAKVKWEDIALVPLACPMIAGPATIAASIALHSQQGLLLPTISLFVALGINHLIMLFSQGIGRFLGHLHILGAIIRITGLIVMTIGTQMALDGIAAWWAAKHL